MEKRKQQQQKKEENISALRFCVSVLVGENIKVFPLNLPKKKKEKKEKDFQFENKTEQQTFAKPVLNEPKILCEKFFSRQRKYGSEKQKKFVVLENLSSKVQ